MPNACAGPNSILGVTRTSTSTIKSSCWSVRRVVRGSGLPAFRRATIPCCHRCTREGHVVVERPPPTHPLQDVLTQTEGKSLTKRTALPQGQLARSWTSLRPSTRGPQTPARAGTSGRVTRRKRRGIESDLDVLSHGRRLVNGACPALAPAPGHVRHGLDGRDRICSWWSAWRRGRWARCLRTLTLRCAHAAVPSRWYRGA